MLVVERNQYESILKKLNLSIESSEKCIDVYHVNNWDRFTKHYNEKNRNACPSYIDFFFDAKSMVDFLKGFIEKESFEYCYIASVYNEKYKLKVIDDDVCKDVYDEFKTLLNSLGIKINTNRAIQMNKYEVLDWCDKLSIGAFCGVSNYSIVIPESDILIIPYHHMNYLIYTNKKDRTLSDVRLLCNDELRYEV